MFYPQNTMCCSKTTHSFGYDLRSYPQNEKCFSYINISMKNFDKYSAIKLCLSHNYPDYKTHCALPPELLFLTLEYLYEISIIDEHLYGCIEAEHINDIRYGLLKIYGTSMKNGTMFPIELYEYYVNDNRTLSTDDFSNE